MDSNLGHNVGHALALDCGCAMNHIMCLNSNENYMEVLTYNTEHVKGFSSAEDSSGFFKISFNSYQANSTRSFGMNQMSQNFRWHEFSHLALCALLLHLSHEPWHDYLVVELKFK